MLVVKLSHLISRRVATCGTKHFEKHCVVPDVIAKAPNKTLKITYPNAVQVYPGCILTPTEVQFEPLLSWDCDPKSYHVICMTDPDAPCRAKPTFREWQHWLLVNVLGCKQSTAQTLSQYIGAGPPKGTGLHRFVFLVYKQPSEIKFEEQLLTNNSGKNRANFSIRRFAEKYELGCPIAGNFFQAEWDDYVPVLYKKLGM